MIRAAIALLAMTLALGTGGPCGAEDTKSEKALVSLDARNETLRGVLERISRATGHEITVNEAWAGRVLSVRLEKVELEKALKHVLKALGSPSHVILTHRDKRKTEILICEDGTRPPAQAEVDVGVTQDNAPDGEDREVAAPEGPEGKRITPGRIETILKRRGSPDPQDTEEIPPEDTD